MLTFSTNPTGLTKSTIARAIKSQSEYTQRIANCAHDFEYACAEASATLPGDERYHQVIYDMIDKKRSLGIDAIVVIGIGGSDLGTRAAYNAVRTKSELEGKHITPIYFLDTVDPLRMESGRRKLRKRLQEGQNVLLNVISKSGGTTETIANFEVLLEIYRAERPRDWHELIVATTGFESAFWKAAKSLGIDTLILQDNVGGRYSVLSAVGLFPLGLAHVDIVSLLNGARVTRDTYIGGVNGEKNASLLSAATLFAAQKKKKTIHDTFLFAKDLEYLGRWYRQLMGESIGKEYDKDKKRVFAGMTPTTSVGSVDLHSVAQLYLGGPADKITTFVTVDEWPVDLQVPPQSAMPPLVEDMRGKTFSQLMDAIYEGTKGAYDKQERPYMEIRLESLDEHHIGAFMQFKMLEMMYLGNLMNVNTFDQPNVEMYKEITRELLKKM